MRVLADAKAMERMVADLASRIAAAMSASGRDDWALVGVRSRGDLLAERLMPRLPTDRIAGRLGTLDITLYRDDLSEIGPQPVVRTTEIPFAIDGLDVVLVDDVLMTGRSTRAALQQLMDLGRPRRVWLAVLVDRGGRELPIAADFVSLSLADGAQAVPDEARVEVSLTPLDARDEIRIVDRRSREALAT